MNSALTTETITTRSAFEALGVEWSALLARAGNTAPFYLHEWLTTWWDLLRQDQLTVRDSLHIVTARLPSRELVAIVPLMLTERPSVGPLRTRMLQSLGADPYLTELKGVIVDPAHGAAAARALAAHLEADRSWDWMYWCGLTRGSPFASELQRDASLAWRNVWPHYVLTLQPTWDLFKKTLKKNIKESLRHCYNSLKRDGIEFTFGVAESPAETQRALREFFRLHTSRAETDDAISHVDRFASPTTRTFLEKIVARLSALGVAKVFTLTVGGQVVAARIGFVVGDSLYLYYSGYDPALRKYSIMTTTVAEALKWAIEKGLKTADLSAGTDVSKTRWGPTEVVIEDAIQARDFPRARAAFGAYNLVAEARANPKFERIAWVLGKRNWQ